MYIYACIYIYNTYISYIMYIYIYIYILYKYVYSNIHIYIYIYIYTLIVYGTRLVKWPLECDVVGEM